MPQPAILMRSSVVGFSRKCHQERRWKLLWWRKIHESARQQSLVDHQAWVIQARIGVWLVGLVWFGLYYRTVLGEPKLMKEKKMGFPPKKMLKIEINPKTLGWASKDWEIFFWAWCFLVFGSLNAMGMATPVILWGNFESSKKGGIKWWPHQHQYFCKYHEHYQAVITIIIR